MKMIVLNYRSIALIIAFSAILKHGSATKLKDDLDILEDLDDSLNECQTSLTDLLALLSTVSTSEGTASSTSLTSESTTSPTASTSSTSEGTASSTSPTSEDTVSTTSPTSPTISTSEGTASSTSEDTESTTSPSSEDTTSPTISTSPATEDTLSSTSPTPEGTTSPTISTSEETESTSSSSIPSSISTESMLTSTESPPKLYNIPVFETRRVRTVNRRVLSHLNLRRNHNYKILEKESAVRKSAAGPDWGDDVNECLSEIDEILAEINSDPYKEGLATDLSATTSNLNILIDEGEEDPNLVADSNDLNELESNAERTLNSTIFTQAYVDSEIEDIEDQITKNLSIILGTTLLVLLVIIVIVIFFVIRYRAKKKEKAQMMLTQSTDYLAPKYEEARQPEEGITNTSFSLPRARLENEQRQKSEANEDPRAYTNPLSQSRLNSRYMK